MAAVLGPRSDNAQPRRRPQTDRKARTESTVGKSTPPAETYNTDFLWVYTEEPHRTRRAQIIVAHPEVVKLCGPEPLTKYLVAAVVLVQLAAAYSLIGCPVLSVRFLVTAYVVGATANQNLFLAIHEISHNLAFRAGWANRALAIVANLPIGIPYSASFRPYHLVHHKSLGVDGRDADLPTWVEAAFLDSILGKAFFCTFQILFYALRPMAVFQIDFTVWHLANVVVQIAFDALVVFVWGWPAVGYFVASSFLAGSLHPCAAHFIAEHYVFAAELTPKTQTGIDQSNRLEGVPAPEAEPPETFSYYGVLNYLTYNVGLHNEHHDFPAIPWTRLWKLNSIANEFYRELPSHPSWVAVIWNFILDRRVGMWCRVKREGGRPGSTRVDKKTGEFVPSRTAGWTMDELQSEVK